MRKPELNNIHNNFTSVAGLHGGDGQSEQLVDLNDIFRAVLDNYSVNGGIIFRCDKLPAANGNSEDFVYLFDALVAMIVSHPPIGSKLYLYVKCFPENVDNEVMDLRVDAQTSIYQIEIYSNITTDKEWETLHQAKLAECNLQAAKVKARFSFSPVVNTGCVFSLTLPGKTS